MYVDLETRFFLWQRLVDRDSSIAIPRWPFEPPVESQGTRRGIRRDPFVTLRSINAAQCGFYSSRQDGFFVNRITSFLPRFEELRADYTVRLQISIAR